MMAPPDNGVVEGRSPMEYTCMQWVNRVIVIVVVFCVVQGCASTGRGGKTFVGDGFQTSLPNAGTRVVVWGNHSGAVNQTLRWLNDHQLLVVDRWVEKELTDSGVAPPTGSEHHSKILSVAHEVGAPLVVFVQINDNQLDRKFDLMSFDDQPMKIIGVEIRGMNAKTGAVVFGGKSWNSEPIMASEQVIRTLTTLALQKAWNASKTPLPPQPEVNQEKVKRERVTVLMPSISQGIVTGAPVSQSGPGKPAATPQEQGTVLLPSTTKENSAEPAVSRLEPVETTENSEDSSFGLHIASGALSILYTPIKLVYAGLGGLMGGMAYMVTGGNEQVTQSIWDASVQGTYWLTPQHLQGHVPIHFKGEPTQGDSGHQAQLD